MTLICGYAFLNLHHILCIDYPINRRLSLHVQKQRESELLRKEESAADRLEQHQNVFDTEFTIDYRQLQKYMAQIYKSTERQEVWFTTKIDANKKNVVSAQIGRKLLPQNVTGSGIKL
jgi:hypothetical protein